MKRVVIRSLLLLYPAAWRNEYGAELEHLLLAGPLRAGILLNVLGSALLQRIQTLSPSRLLRSLALRTGGEVAFPILGFFRLVLTATALWYGIQTIGYWVALQLGGLESHQKGRITLTLCYSAFLFFALTLASAYLRMWAGGPRAVLCKALYLTAAHGLPSIALFAFVSRGAIFQLPEVMSLVVLLVCLLLAFRSADPARKHPVN